MLFNSAPFLFFFPLVTSFYFLCPHPYRWALLLAASCIFYMWFIPQYLLVLFILISIDYYMGMLIEDARIKGVHAKKYLIVSILATCSVLIIFKYFNFFSSNFSALGGFFGLHYPAKVMDFILPIGLSFHTLQSLSYVIEVYKGRQGAERHFGIYSLYVMFYPQLVAGPIERPYNLLPQFREKHYVDYQRIADALKLMAWGMFKKVVIADRMAVLVDQVYGNVRGYQGPEFLIVMVLCAVQVYCDFSGYSDIAVGSAKAMGYRLTNNFNFPFFSRSMSDYWKRWNISFFSWVRDYIYIPLCQSRYWGDKRGVNIFIVFLFSGFWHGADWTYILWGGVNGFYLIFARWTQGIRQKIRIIIGLVESSFLCKFWQTSITFLLFCFAGIFFRASSIEDAFYIINRLFQGWTDNFLIVLHTRLGFSLEWWAISFVIVSFLLFVELFQQNNKILHMFLKASGWVRWVYYYGLILAIIILGNYERNQFVYFQF